MRLSYSLLITLCKTHTSEFPTLALRAGFGSRLAGSFVRCRTVSVLEALPDLRDRGYHYEHHEPEEERLLARAPAGKEDVVQISGEFHATLFPLAHLP